MSPPTKDGRAPTRKQDQTASRASVTGLKSTLEQKRQQIAELEKQIEQDERNRRRVQKEQAESPSQVRQQKRALAPNPYRQLDDQVTPLRHPVAVGRASKAPHTPVQPGQAPQRVEPAQPASPTPLTALSPQDLLDLSTTMLPPTLNPKDVDLNSASATKTLRFLFPGDEPNHLPGKYKETIVLFSTSNPAMACLELKRYLFKCHVPENRRAVGMVRMEGQRLDEAWDKMVENEHSRKTTTTSAGPGSKTAAGLKFLPAGQKGWILICPYIATVPNLPQGNVYSVLAVLIPGSPEVRWFYTPYRVGDCLRHLHTLGNLDRSLDLEVEKDIASGTQSHARLFTFVRNAFRAAVSFPDSPDFVNAQMITDFAPPIRDVQGALGRLEMNEFWHNVKPFGKEKASAKENKKTKGKEGEEEVQPSDDRYLGHLDPAEREIAYMVGLKGAEYLLVKREFFKAFFREVYRSDKPIAVVDNNGNNTSDEAMEGERPAAAAPMTEVDGEKEDTTMTDADSTPAPTTNEATTSPPAAAGTSPFRPLPAATPAPTSEHTATATATPASSPFNPKLRRTARSRAREDTPQSGYSPSVASTDTRPTSNRAAGSPAGNRAGDPAGAPTGRAAGRSNYAKQIRTTHAHQVWLENVYEFTVTRAKTLLVGWKEM